MSAQTVKHKAKDSVFTDLFSKPKYLLQLYREIHLENREVTEKNIKNVSFTKVLKEQEEEVISIMADLFDDDETIFNMFVESEKRQAAKKAERRTQRRMERRAAAKDRRTAQRLYGMGNSVENIAMVLEVSEKLVEKWLNCS